MGGVLLFYPVFDVDVWEWLMLCFYLLMVELFEGFFYVARHCQMNLALFVVPVECDADVPFAFPLSGDGIGLLERAL